MIRVFLIHGWGGSSNKDWMPWMTTELRKKGYDVFVPSMPDTDNPKIDSWVNVLEELVGGTRETDILIGHSIGCQTILRFLEKLPFGRKVDKVILVAPWFELMNLENEEMWRITDPWIKTQIKFSEVIGKANSFITLFSDDDPWVPIEINLKLFRERLNPEVIVLKNKGHFTEDEGIKSIPELLKLV